MMMCAIMKNGGGGCHGEHCIGVCVWVYSNSKIGNLDFILYLQWCFVSVIVVSLPSRSLTRFPLPSQLSDPMHGLHTFFATIPSGGLVSTFLDPTSAQLVDKQVPLLSTKLFIMARRVSSSAPL